MQGMLLGSGPLLLSRDSQRPRHARAVCRVRPRAVLYMALLDVQARVAHCASGVVEEPLLLGGRHQPEKIARLLPGIIVDAMVIVRRLTLDRQWRLGEIGLIVPQPGAVRVEAGGGAGIAVDPHLPAGGE